VRTRFLEEAILGMGVLRFFLKEAGV
jgi:hypothetical protein